MLYISGFAVYTHCAACLECVRIPNENAAVRADIFGNMRRCLCADFCTRFPDGFVLRMGNLIHLVNGRTGNDVVELI